MSEQKESVIEYRKKHPCCAYCKHFYSYSIDYNEGLCKVKKKYMWITFSFPFPRGRFCRMFEAEDGGE